MGLSKPNGRIRQLGLRPLGPDGAPLSSRLLRSAHRPHPTARMTGRLGRWRRDHHVKGPSAPPRRFRARLASSTSPRAVSHSCSESRARPEVDRRKITHPPGSSSTSCIYLFSGGEQQLPRHGRRREASFKSRCSIEYMER